MLTCPTATCIGMHAGEQGIELATLRLVTLPTLSGAACTPPQQMLRWCHSFCTHPGVASKGRVHRRMPHQLAQNPMTAEGEPGAQGLRL